MESGTPRKLGHFLIPVKETKHVLKLRINLFGLITVTPVLLSWSRSFRHVARGLFSMWEGAMDSWPKA